MVSSARLQQAKSISRPTTSKWRRLLKKRASFRHETVGSPESRTRRARDRSRVIVTSTRGAN